MRYHSNFVKIVVLTRERQHTTENKNSLNHKVVPFTIVNSIQISKPFKTIESQTTDILS